MRRLLTVALALGTALLAAEAARPSACPDRQLWSGGKIRGYTGGPPFGAKIPAAFTLDRRRDADILARCNRPLKQRT